jgi:hypothetical protein
MLSQEYAQRIEQAVKAAAVATRAAISVPILPDAVDRRGIAAIAGLLPGALVGSVV